MPARKKGSLGTKDEDAGLNVMLKGFNEKGLRAEKMNKKRVEEMKRMENASLGVRDGLAELSIRLDTCLDEMQGIGEPSDGTVTERDVHLSTQATLGARERRSLNRELDMWASKTLTSDTDNAQARLREIQRETHNLDTTFISKNIENKLSELTALSKGTSELLATTANDKAEAQAELIVLRRKMETLMQLVRTNPEYELRELINSKEKLITILRHKEHIHEHRVRILQNALCDAEAEQNPSYKELQEAKKAVNELRRELITTKKECARYREECEAAAVAHAEYKETVQAELAAAAAVVPLVVAPEAVPCQTAAVQTEDPIVEKVETCEQQAQTDKIANTLIIKPDKESLEAVKKLSAANSTLHGSLKCLRVIYTHQNEVRKKRLVTNYLLALSFRFRLRFTARQNAMLSAKVTSLQAQLCATNSTLKEMKTMIASGGPSEVVRQQNAELTVEVDKQKQKKQDLVVELAEVRRTKVSVSTVTEVMGLWGMAVTEVATQLRQTQQELATWMNSIKDVELLQLTSRTLKTLSTKLSVRVKSTLQYLATILQEYKPSHSLFLYCQTEHPAFQEVYSELMKLAEWQHPIPESYLLLTAFMEQDVYSSRSQVYSRSHSHSHSLSMDNISINQNDDQSALPVTSARPSIASRRASTVFDAGQSSQQGTPWSENLAGLEFTPSHSDYSPEQEIFRNLLPEGRKSTVPRKRSSTRKSLVESLYNDAHTVCVEDRDVQATVATQEWGCQKGPPLGTLDLIVCADAAVMAAEQVSHVIDILKLPDILSNWHVRSALNDDIQEVRDIVDARDSTFDGLRVVREQKKKVSALMKDTVAEVMRRVVLRARLNVLCKGTRANSYSEMQLVTLAKKFQDTGYRQAGMMRQRCELLEKMLETCANEEVDYRFTVLPNNKNLHHPSPRGRPAYPLCINPSRKVRTPTAGSVGWEEYMEVKQYATVNVETRLSGITAWDRAKMLRAIRDGESRKADDTLPPKKPSYPQPTSKRKVRFADGVLLPSDARAQPGVWNILPPEATDHILA